MPSSASNTASPTDTRDSSPTSLAAQAQARLDKRRKHAPKPAEPSSVVASIPKTPTSLSDEERDRRASEYERKQQEIRRRDMIDHCVNNSGLPVRHISTKPQEGTPWAAARQEIWGAVWAGDSVLLTGPRGTGKTQIAVSVGMEIAENARSVAYLKASEMFRLCREAMQDNRESEQVNRYKRVGLLIVDEAHVRVETDYEDRILTEIVDGRYDQCKPTILITNQTEREAAKSLGPSIVSRFRETGLVMNCNWQGFR